MLSTLDLQSVLKVVGLSDSYNWISTCILGIDRWTMEDLVPKVWEYLESHVD